MRQPKWLTDEVILAIDAYYRINDVKDITKNNRVVIELSDLLKSLPFHKNKDEIFRNVSGVIMTLLNIASLDETSSYFFGKASKLQKKIYQYFTDKRKVLRSISIAIRNCLPLPFEYYNSTNPTNFMVSDILYLYHLFIENKSNVSILTKRDFLRRRRSKCSVCGLYLMELYGENGCELLELHYTENIQNYGNEMKILPGKFIAMCPNCHKLAHTTPVFI